MEEFVVVELVRGFLVAVFVEFLGEVEFGAEDVDLFVLLVEDLLVCCLHGL